MIVRVERCGLRVEIVREAVVAKYPPNEVSRVAVARGVHPRRRGRTDTMLLHRTACDDEASSPLPLRTTIYPLPTINRKS